MAYRSSRGDPLLLDGRSKENSNRLSLTGRRKLSEKTVQASAQKALKGLRTAGSKLPRGEPVIDGL